MEVCFRDPNPISIPERRRLRSNYDLNERIKFWDSPNTIQWFQERGYTYTPLGDDEENAELCFALPETPFEQPMKADYPYAYYESFGNAILGPRNISGKVVFAQDSQGRHVAIKLVGDNTDEYRILRFLSEQSLETLKENCIIPVLDFLPVHEFWFVVMPRWGDAVHLPWIKKADDLLEIVHSMLTALAFLHHHNISHGDIKLSNVLVNHFSDTIHHISSSTIRTHLRSKRLLSYAMFDFDFSVMLPPEADRSKYRLPYQMSLGSFNLTMDTAQGEFEFNPFILDVGSLGVCLCHEYQHLTDRIPMLAPLLDRMTTRDLQRRFTASEALCFFESMFTQLTNADLEQYVDTYAVCLLGTWYDAYDRWEKVPSDFAEKWASYREPPIPRSTKILRAICQWPVMHHIVRWIRRSFLYVSPRRVYTRLLGLRFSKFS